MIPLLLAAAFPTLFWPAGPDTIPALKAAGIGCVHVPIEQAAAWVKAGACHTPVPPAALESRQKLPVPGVQFRMNIASATRSPWVDANGWRFARSPAGHFLYDLPRGKAALAAAEAFAYGADAWLRIDPQDLEPLGRMLQFLKGVPGDAALRPLANFCVADDGTPTAGEVLNLLTRRNLLFTIASDARCEVRVQIGSDAANPSQFADKLRRQLGDDKRLLRIYGSELVLGRLVAAPDGSHARLHLINYAPSTMEGLRIRVLGSYSKLDLAVTGFDAAKPEDVDRTATATEFTIPQMGVYAVADLRRR